MAIYNNDNEELTDSVLYDMYDEFLDEAFSPAQVGGYEYNTSTALKALDPIAYRCGFTDWLDAEVQDGSLVER